MRRNNGFVTEKAHLNTNKKSFDENFDRIFGKKKEEKPEKKSEIDLYKEALDKSHDVHLKLTVDYLDLKNENDQLKEILRELNTLTKFMYEKMPCDSTYSENCTPCSYDEFLNAYNLEDILIKAQ